MRMMPRVKSQAITVEERTPWRSGSALKAGAVYDWLSAEYGLGRGHSMAIFSVLKDAETPRAAPEDRVEKQFAGAKSVWRPSFDRIVARAEALGEVQLAPTDTYISLVRGGRKFAIVAVTAKRLDLGLKLPGVDPGDRFEPSGSWNSMVTHRARLDDPTALDDDLLQWLDHAYASASPRP